MKLLVPTAAFFLAAAISCNQPQTKVAHEQWFNNTKGEILRQASAEPDSTAYTNGDYPDQRVQLLYRERRLLSRKLFDHDVLRLEVFFSKDGQFEFRREYFPNGNKSYEGIRYNNAGYGITTVWLENGQEFTRGVLFNGNPVGEWKNFPPGSKEAVTADYGGITSLSEFPVLKKQ
ncbi:hypothetical protein [Chitinophaga sp. CB10]|uniref:hypothetical protein n=1 Tax=Chitinophaga sp. CB10 TaxID=1891659 RepID=UPI0025B935EC|nr:hypothetical protein [Chitinophaga sp. CB10]